MGNPLSITSLRDSNDHFPADTTTELQKEEQIADFDCYGLWGKFVQIFEGHLLVKIIATPCIILLASIIFFMVEIQDFVVAGIYNYASVNVRQYLWIDVLLERERLLLNYQYNGAALTMGKLLHMSRRYKAYWITILSLVTFSLFVNIGFVDLQKLFAQMEIFGKGSEVTNYAAQLILSIIVGFANIFPAKPIRSTVNCISSFTMQDIVVRDSAHTRLKTLREVLDDLRQYECTLFESGSGNPIIITTLELNQLDKSLTFELLMNTDAFSSNQVLRIIQIRDDIDSFKVERDVMGMCHNVSVAMGNPFVNPVKNKLRVDIRDQELTVYGSVTVVLLVVTFVSSTPIHLSSILVAWITLPVLFAVLFRRKRHKLTSIVLFSLEGVERNFEPQLNLIVRTDDKILHSIAQFKFFHTLQKLSPLGEAYLIHVLLSCMEGVTYNWPTCGIQINQFKRLVEKLAALYGVDFAIVTPRAKGRTKA